MGVKGYIVIYLICRGVLMEKIIRFKRNWEESYIRICVIEGLRVEIDTPMYLFLKRFLELVEIPLWKFIFSFGRGKVVKDAVGDAFEKTVKELKDETIRV